MDGEEPNEGPDERPETIQNPITLRTKEQKDMPLGVPWYQLPGESPEHFALFVRYLSAESSNVQAFTRSCPEAPRKTPEIAARWRWKARRAALDHYMMEERTKSMAEGAREQGRLHAAAWALALDWAVESILVHRANGTILDPKDALAFLDKAFQAQRLMAGQTSINLGIDLTRADMADLDRMDEILAKLEIKDANPNPNTST